MPGIGRKPGFYTFLELLKAKQTHPKKVRTDNHLTDKKENKHRGKDIHGEERHGLGSGEEGLCAIDGR